MLRQKSQKTKEVYEESVPLLHQKPNTTARYFTAVIDSLGRHVQSITRHTTAQPHAQTLQPHTHTPLPTDTGRGQYHLFQYLSDLLQPCMLAGHRACLLDSCDRHLTQQGTFVRLRVNAKVCGEMIFSYTGPSVRYSRPLTLSHSGDCSSFTTAFIPPPPPPVQNCFKPVGLFHNRFCLRRM